MQIRGGPMISGGGGGVRAQKNALTAGFLDPLKGPGSSGILAAPSFYTVICDPASQNHQKKSPDLSWNVTH